MCVKPSKKVHFSQPRHHQKLWRGERRALFLHSWFFQDEKEKGLAYQNPRMTKLLLVARQKINELSTTHMKKYHTHFITITTAKTQQMVFSQTLRRKMKMHHAFSIPHLKKTEYLYKNSWAGASTGTHWNSAANKYSMYHCIIHFFL